MSDYDEGYLEEELRYWRNDSADAWDKCEANRVKLAKAMSALERIAEVGGEYADVWDAQVCGNIARKAIAELKGQDDES